MTVDGTDFRQILMLAADLFGSEAAAIAGRRADWCRRHGDGDRQVVWEAVAAELKPRWRVTG